MTTTEPIRRALLPCSHNNGACEVMYVTIKDKNPSDQVSLDEHSDGMQTIKTEMLKRFEDFVQAEHGNISRKTMREVRRTLVKRWEHKPDEGESLNVQHVKYANARFTKAAAKWDRILLVIFIKKTQALFEQSKLKQYKCHIILAG